MAMREVYAVILTFFFVLGCTHELPVPNDPSEGTVNESIDCDPDTVYFVQDILPLLVSNCAMTDCHDVASHEEGIILDSYLNIVFGEEENLIVPGSLGASELYEVITEDDPDKIMPPPPASPLSAEQIEMIANWILQGATNNSCRDCDSAQFSFASVIFPMVENYCIACHSGSEPDAGLILASHESITGAVSYLNLLERISHAAGYDPMPPSGDGLSSCQIQQWQNWIGAGMPND